MAKPRQKSREGQSVSDDTVARYTAARAFLVGEWIGAILMVGSFTQLYLVAFVFGGTVRLSVGLGLGALLLGAWMFWTNRTHYLGLNFPFRRRWEVVAVIFAGAGAVFWLLFGLLAALVWQGIPIQK